MRILLAFIFLVNSFCSYSIGQTSADIIQKQSHLQINRTDTDPFSRDKAHPKAKAILTEAFYWNLTEESAPFGNEESIAAFEGFRQWRPLNPQASPVVYLTDLVASWDYPDVDLTVLTLDGISTYITSNSLGARALIGQDNVIIGVGFGQLVLEGRIDEDIKNLTKIALQRELLPVLLSHFPEDYQPKRREILSKMLEVVDQMNQ